MKFNAKKFLLTGTALVAAVSFSTQAQAAPFTHTAAAITSGVTGVWANTTAGVQANATSADAEHAGHGDSIDIAAGATITVSNDGSNDDGSADANTFTLGAVANTAGTGNLTVVNGSSALLTTNITSINVAGTASFTTINNALGAQTDNVSGGLTAGTLTVSNTLQNTADMDLALNVTGAVATTNASTIVGGTFNGASTTVTVGGNSAFGGGITLTGGAGTASNAVLNLNGATNTGNIAVATAAKSILNVGSNTSTAQSVAGGITGNGNINVSNSSATGVTFSGIVNMGGTNAITIDNSNAATSNSTATFKAAVTTGSGGFVLGNAGTGTNTLVFDGTTAAFTATGAITGAAAGETNVVKVIGGHTITQGATAWGTNIDTVAISGTGTKLTTGAAITADAVTIGSGSTLDNAAGLVTSTVTGVTNNGAITFTGGTGITGNVSGTGTITASNSAKILGNVSASTVTVANGATLTNESTAASNGTFTASSIVLNNAAGLVFDADSTKTLTVTGAITQGTTPNAGTIVLGTDNEVEAYTFNSNIGTAASKLNTLTIASLATAQTVNFYGNVYTNGALTIGQADVVNFLGSSQTVSGNVATATTAGSTINVGDGATASNVTFGGTIGAGTALAQVNVKALSTANVGKSVSVSAANNATLGVNMDGTLNLDATNAGGTLTVADATGDIDVDGTVNVSGTTNNVTISAASDLFIDGTLNTSITKATPVLTLTGTNSVVIGATSDTTINAGNQISLTGPVTIGNTGRTTTLNIVRTASFDPDTTTVVTSAGNVTLAAGSTLKVGVGGNSNALTDGSTITALHSAGGTNLATALTGGQIVLQDSGLVHLRNNTTTATDLNVIADFKDADEVFGDEVGAGAAESLMANTTATGNLGTIRTNLLNAPTAAEAQNIAEAASPTVDGSNIAAAFAATGQVFGVTQMRLASLEDGSAGMAAGDMMTGAHAWGQIFGQSANQDVHNGVDGYDAKTYGFALGSDVDAFDGRGHIGAAISYANTDADSDNANTTNTKIDSYQATLYGDVGIQNDMYLKGMVGYAFNDNDSTRHNVGGLAGVTASGDYNANQFSARAEVGRPFAMQQGFVLTPTVTADYAYYNAESYTETGAGTANLNVDQDSLNKFDLGIGLAASTRFQDNSGGTWKPGVSASYKYDLVGDEIQDTSSFTGGGAAFNTKGLDPARSQFAVGANVKYMTVNNWDFSAEYTYEFKSDYDAHDGILRAGYKF